MDSLRLFPFGVAVLVYQLIGSVVAWIAGWPPQFGGDPDPDQSYVSYLLGGSAVAAPLAPLVGLLVGIVLARRRDRWRILGLVMVGIVGVLFTIGVLGELFAEHPHVPMPVIVIAGMINLLISLTLLYLVAQTARGRSASAPRDAHSAPGSGVG